MTRHRDRPTALGAAARLALMPAAALAVHQLRFALAFGGHAQLQLERQAHAYLHSLVPWIVLSLAAAAGAFARALGRALSGQRSLARYSFSVLGLWLVCACCLLAIYTAQELLEGLFATGHLTGLAGVFGYGGWWSIPAAACVALVLAVIFHGARWVLDEVAQRHRPPRTLDTSDRRRAAPLTELPLARLSPLAYGWSGRGPPA
jgi:hypothetical protein